MTFSLRSGVPLVEVVRGGSVESVHTGSLVVLTPDGTVRHAVGHVERPAFPRSSAKPLQALAMLRAGLDVPDDALAAATGSHAGEPGHVEMARRILSGAGLTEDALLCPPDLPMSLTARDEVIREGGGARRVYMNCSGKHSAVLATCVAAGWPTASYVEPTHPFADACRTVVEELTGEPVAAEAVDGCGLPVLAYSLTGLARAFSRFVVADAGTAERRVADAMRAHPFYVAGTGREDTDLMRTVPGLLVKGGAEGVHAFALADGTAVAFKVDDGASRPRVPVIRAVLAALGVALTDVPAPDPVLGGGTPTGELRVVPDVLDGLSR